MPSARILVACALVAAIGALHLSTCAGWDSSAQARMACCERSVDCEDGILASACCAAGERNDSPEMSAATAAPSPARIAAAPDRDDRRLQRARVQPSITPAPDVFRNAVLLI